MQQQFAPVPVIRSDLIGEVRAAGVRVTDSRHRGGVTIPRHAHRHAAVTFLMEGSFAESYPVRRAILCEAPAVHVRPAGEPHEDRLGSHGARNLVVELEAGRLEPLRSHSALFDDVRQIRGGALMSIARRLRRELVMDDSASPLAVQGIALELLALASRGAGRAIDRRPGWLVRVRDLLHDRFREPLPGMDHLAEVAGVHPVYLARAFRAAFGASPGEYLRQRRLEWCAEQLRSTTRPIAEIAVDAGFADQSHCTRTFKAAYGEPPGAWRRRHGAPESHARSRSGRSTR